MASQSGGQKTGIPTFRIESPSTNSYAAAAAIRREQGIVLDCIEGLNLTDYTCAIGDLVNKNNVLCASRISNNRICVYVATKELVNQTTANHEFITINEHKVNLRPLVSRNKRIIFSNVSPELPNYVLEKVLTELKINPASTITTLRAGINKEGYNHVLSFRRQIYVKPEDVEKIPETFRINFDNMDYYIFASTEVLKCFICKIEGHLARNCPNTDISNNRIIDSQKPEQNHTPEENMRDGNVPKLHETIDTTLLDTPPLQSQKTDNKRTRSVVSSNESQNEETFNSTQTNTKKLTNPNKRNKNETENHRELIEANTQNNSRRPETEENITEDETDKKLRNIKDYLNKGITLLNYDQFKNFLESSKGIRNPINIISQYTDNTEAFIKFLETDIYPNVRNTSIKKRCTTIINKINDIKQNKTPQSTPQNTPGNSDSETEIET